MSSQTPRAPRPVLLQFAGNVHNAPDRGDARPAMRVAAKVGPTERAFVLYTRGDETSRSHAEAVARDVNRLRRGGHSTRTLAVDAGTPAEPQRRASVREAVDRFVDLLAGTELGARFAETEFVVSLATGTAAQWSCLVDALDARGVRVSLAWDSLDETISIWRGSSEAYGVEPDIAMLERAPAARTVLLTGPTGAGKSRTAQRLHDAWRANLGRGGAMASVNAAALPRELLESILFGHARGSYTGADRDAKGRLAAAHEGTLFLDEIGELPLDLQSKLLTVLDVDPATGLRTFMPVGASEPERSNFRLVLGTNQDLLAMTRAGRFRVDLYGRVSTHQIALPPLSAVRHRIPSAYVQHLESLLAHYPKVGKAHVPFSLAGDARQRLLDFALSPRSAWPWNHRDVQQSAERLAMRAWNRRAPSGDAGKPATRRSVQIHLDEVAAEIAELERRWTALGATSDGEETAWDAVRARVRGDAWEGLARVDRWELRYLLEAKAQNDSNAEAWRWIAAHNLLAGARDEVKNPSNAFAKRWAKYQGMLRDRGG